MRLALVILCAWSIAQAQPADLSGRVLDADGQPVAGARVCYVRNLLLIYVGAPMEQLPHTLTDENGNFCFERGAVDPRERGALVAFHPEKGISKAHPVNRLPRELRLIPLKAFRGQVTDPEGKAVAGATVRWVFASADIPDDGIMPPAEQPFVVTTDAEGGFTLPLPVRAPYLMLICTAPGFAPQEHVVQQSTGGELSADALKIKLTPAAKLRARFVHARTGEPAAHLPVLVGANIPLALTTDSDGLLVAEVPPAPVEIAPGWDFSSPTLVPTATFTPVKASLSQPGTELDLGTIQVFTAPKVTLEVRNQNGQPLPYTGVSLRHRSEERGFLYFTDARGRLSLPLAEGTYTAQVVLVSPGEAWTSREVIVTVQGDKPQPVVITARQERVWRQQEVRLRVRTSRGQMPKKPWVQAVTSTMGEALSSRVEKDALVLQSYGIAGEPLPEVVLIDAVTGEGAVLKNVNPNNPPREVRLKPLPRVYGRVLDTAGKPIAGASAHLIFGRFVQIRIGDEDRVSRFWSERVTPALATTDRSGRFALPIMPDPDITSWVLIRARGYAPGVAPIVRGKPITLRLSEATHQYAGTVMTVYGEPLSGATVRAQYRARGSSGMVSASGSAPRVPTQSVTLSEVQTDAQGRFAFSAMPERIELNAFTRQYNLSPVALTVKPSRDLLIVLTTPRWQRAEAQSTTPNVHLLLKQVEWLNPPPPTADRESLLIFTAPYLAQNESLFASLRDLPADRWQVMVVFDSYSRAEVEQYCRRVSPVGFVGWWKPRGESDLPALIHEVLPTLPYIVIMDKSGKPQRFGVKVSDLSRTLSVSR